MIGIYKIENKINNNTYIGQSKDIENRWITHKEDLKNNKHHQRKLQKEYNKLVKQLRTTHINDTNYKYIDFDLMTLDKYYNFEVIKTFNTYNIAELLKLEDEFILEYREEQKGYNQLTNEEIKNLNVDILIRLKEFREQYPEYYNYKINDKLKDLNDIKLKYNDGEITLNKLIELSKQVGINYGKEYINKYGDIFK